MQVKSLRYPPTAHKLNCNSNLPTIEHKDQIRKIFEWQNTKKNNPTDLATESSDSVASLK